MMTSVTIRTERTYPNFLGIASDALIKLTEIEGILSEEVADSARYLELRVQRFNQYAIMVVFTGMCIEAFLYDYAAHCFGDDFVRSHLDKLGFLSKCEVYPRLVTGHEVDKSGKAWASIALLKKERNDFVHWKSAKPHEDINVEAERKRKRTKAAASLPFTAILVYSTLHLYACELCKLHTITKHTHPFPNLFRREAEQEHRRVQLTSKTRNSADTCSVAVPVSQN
jgi:hypothetical protein